MDEQFQIFPLNLILYYEVFITKTKTSIKIIKHIDKAFSDAVW